MAESILSEADMQMAVFTWRHRIQPFPIILTNIYFLGWESDALYITRSGHMWEFEIKRTHSDFRADAIKYKHERMQNGHGPSRFFYVSPPGIIRIDELPPHAGLAEVVPTRPYYNNDPDSMMYTLNVLKDAPRRFGKVIKDREWAIFADKACERYWFQRRHRYYDSLRRRTHNVLNLA